MIVDRDVVPYGRRSRPPSARSSTPASSAWPSNGSSCTPTSPTRSSRPWSRRPGRSTATPRTEPPARARWSTTRAVESVLAHVGAPSTRAPACSTGGGRARGPGLDAGCFVEPTVLVTLPPSWPCGPRRRSVPSSRGRRRPRSTRRSPGRGRVPTASRPRADAGRWSTRCARPTSSRWHRSEVHAVFVALPAAPRTRAAQLYRPRLRAGPCSASSPCSRPSTSRGCRAR